MTAISIIFPFFLSPLLDLLIESFSSPPTDVGLDLGLDSGWPVSKLWCCFGEPVKLLIWSCASGCCHPDKLHVQYIISAFMHLINCPDQSLFLKASQRCQDATSHFSYQYMAQRGGLFLSLSEESNKQNTKQPSALLTVKVQRQDSLLGTEIAAMLLLDHAEQQPVNPSTANSPAVCDWLLAPIQRGDPASKDATQKASPSHTPHTHRHRSSWHTVSLTT